MTRAEPPPRHMRSFQPRYGSAGFTLLELLIALSLFGLITVLLHSGLRFGAAAWETQERVGGSRAEVQVVRELLRRQFERARVPQGIAAGEDDLPAFAGTEESVTFIAPLPAQLALGGLYRQSLFLDEEQSVGRLVMTWELERPRRGNDRVPPVEGRAVLLEPVVGVQFAYFGLREEDLGEDRKAWLDVWDRPESLPDLVRVRVRISPDDEDVWSEVVARLLLASNP